MNKYLILVLFLFSNLTICLSQTNVSGGIYTNAKWTKNGSPYIVTSNITLFPGYTLTIDPGVVVKFIKDTKLTIRGSLIAIGTINDSITFTSNLLKPKRGDWDMISIETWNGGKAEFRFCNIEFAYHGIDMGYASAGVGPVLLSRTNFYNNQVGTYGYAGFDLLVDSCTFNKNVGAVQSHYSIIRHSSFYNNTYGTYNIRTSVYNSIFCGNDVAISAEGGPVRNCTINNNNIGVQPYYSLNNIDSNSIIQNNIGVILATTDLGIHNKICNNTSYNIQNQNSYPLNTTNNCFCSTDSTYIAGTINDGYDDISLGLIDFIPFDVCSEKDLPFTTNCNDVITELKSSLFSNSLFSIYTYPNPFSIFTTFQFNKPLKDATLIIYNINGIKVKQINNINESKITIQRDNLTTGLYVVQIIEQNNIIASEKLMISEYSN